MSRLTTKYNGLPTLDQIQEYVNGTLNKEEKSWMERVMAENPMVHEAVVAGADIDFTAVRSVSEALKTRVDEAVLSKIGFWRKNWGWIGLSVIILTLGGLYLIPSGKEALYSPKAHFSAQLIEVENGAEGTDATLQPKHSGEQNGELFVSTSEMENQFDVEEGAIFTDVILTDDSTKQIRQSHPEGEERPPYKTPQEKVEESTRDFNSGTAKKVSTMRAVSNVSILQKINPSASKVKKRGGPSGGDPLGRKNTSTKYKEYDAEDLPTYPGGDDALLSFFQGKIRPIHSKNHDAYDKSVYVHLLISTRGKLVESRIMGKPHPEFKSQIERAIAELPRFMPGKKGKLQYMLAISF